MNTTAWITGVLSALMLLAAALGSVSGAVAHLAQQEALYSGMSRAAAAEFLGVTQAEDADAQVSAYIGLDARQQAEFAAQMAAFMRGDTQAPPPLLNEREALHMQDVRGLIRFAGELSRVCLTLAAALAVAAAWVGAGLARRAPARLCGYAAALAVMLAAALGLAYAIGHGGFSGAFEGMHRLLFTNDLWLLDPAQDMLIRMMPLPLFERAMGLCVRRALAVLGVTTALLLAIDGLVGGMIRRQLKREETA